jgi:hypothetical protein
MKKITIFCFTLLIGGVAKSQSPTNEKEIVKSTIHHGFYGGITMPQLKDGDILHPAFQGYKFGYQFNLFSAQKKNEGKGQQINISICYVQKGAIYKETPVIYEVESQKRINALQFEFFATKRLFKIGDIIKTRALYGVYASHFLNGQNDVSYIVGAPTSVPLKFGYDFANDDFKPFDVGLKFGLQLEVKKVFFRSSIELGINQLRPGKTNQEIHNRVIDIVAGINF